MPLEDRAQEIHQAGSSGLNAVHLNDEKLVQVFDLVAKFPGKCPLFSASATPRARNRLHRSARKVFCDCRLARIAEGRDGMFGEDTYYARVDTSLPERPKRVGTKAGGAGNGGVRRADNRTLDCFGARNWVLASQRNELSFQLLVLMAT
jgi:hypothetical protein